MKELRRALGDTANGRPLIRTSHGVGYAFSESSRRAVRARCRNGFVDRCPPVRESQRRCRERLLHRWTDGRASSARSPTSPAYRCRRGRPCSTFAARRSTSRRSRGSFTSTECLKAASDEMEPDCELPLGLSTSRLVANSVGAVRPRNGGCVRHPRRHCACDRHGARADAHCSATGGRTTAYEQHRSIRTVSKGPPPLAPAHTRKPATIHRAFRRRRRLDPEYALALTGLAGSSRFLRSMATFPSKMRAPQRQRQRAAR